MNSSRLGFLLLNVMTLLLIAVAIAGLALQGHPAWFAISAGVFWGLVPIGLLFGLAEAAVPGWVIRWREQVMARDDNDVRQRAGASFSRWLAISGPRPWESPTARFRVRVLGLESLAFWVIGGAIALWLSAYFDQPIA
jgi:hypothetical protein